MIEGPIRIGRDGEIRAGAYLRGGCWLGDGCVVGANVEVKRGIFLDGAPASRGGTCVIRENVVGGNETGVAYEPSVAAVFTGNAFIANRSDVEALGRAAAGAQANRWARNYWSDYVGFDADGDGAGDAEHRIERFFDGLAERWPAQDVHAGAGRTARATRAPAPGIPAELRPGLLASQFGDVLLALRLVADVVNDHAADGRQPADPMTWECAQVVWRVWQAWTETAEQLRELENAIDRLRAEISGR